MDGGGDGSASALRASLVFRGAVPSGLLLQRDPPLSPLEASTLCGLLVIYEGGYPRRFRCLTGFLGVIKEILNHSSVGR